LRGAGGFVPIEINDTVWKCKVDVVRRGLAKLTGDPEFLNAASSSKLA
jgi:hypothetical protein